MMHMRLLFIAAFLAAILAIAYRMVDPALRKKAWKTASPYLRVGAMAAGMVVLFALFVYYIGTH